MTDVTSKLSHVITANIGQEYKRIEMLSIVERELTLNIGILHPWVT